MIRVIVDNSLSEQKTIIEKDAQAAAVKIAMETLKQEILVRFII